MLTITIKDTFDNKSYTGEFQNVGEAMDFYAEALDTSPNAIIITKIEGRK